MSVQEPTWLGWTWRAHFNDLHDMIVKEQWWGVAATLAKMTVYAIERTGRP